MSKSSRPNFLLFITDQHRADFLGCYGHPVLRTPHINSIAARGTAFDRFYVASPVCQPNRASLMTGRMPSVHDVRSNGIPLSMEAVTFVDLLARRRLHAPRWSARAICRTSRHTTRSSSGRRRARAFTSRRRASRQSLRDHLDDPKYEQETPAYWTKPGAHVQTPFYGFDHVTLVRAHGDEAGADYDRWLDARDPKARRICSVRRTACRTTTACRRPIAPRSRRSFTPPRSSASAPAPISTRPRTTSRSS